MINVEIENVVVPAGDPGEQLIANLVLSTMAFDLHAESPARRHLAQAHLLAMDLADQSLVYRPPRPSQFARLTCELDGLIETILLPLISNSLIFPTIVPISGTGRCDTDAPIVDVKALDLARFMLRLRPRRIASVLASLEKAAPSQQSTDTMRRILAACTRHELPAAEPLDRAHDFFTLASNLIAKRNFQLSRLALSNADRSLGEAYAQADSASEHAVTILHMKQQIARMLDELKCAAV